VTKRRTAAHERAASGRWESDQDHPGRVHVRGEYKPAEVFVLRQQDPTLHQRNLHQVFVDGTLLKLTYRKHVMTVSAQGANHREIAAFVRQKSHPQDYSGASDSRVSCAMASAA
jgi:hypothetical protein